MPGLDPDELALALVQGPGEPELPDFPEFQPGFQVPAFPIAQMQVNVPLPVYAIGLEEPVEDDDVIILN